MDINLKFQLREKSYLVILILLILKIFPDSLSPLFFHKIKNRTLVAIHCLESYHEKF